MADKRLKFLKKEIEVKDKIIGALLKELIERKIALPDYVVTILQTLYNRSFDNVREKKENTKN